MVTSAGQGQLRGGSAALGEVPRSVAGAISLKGQSLDLLRIEPYVTAQRLSLPELCSEYEGVGLEDIFVLSIETTDYGQCVHLIDRIQPFFTRVATPGEVEETVLAELRLLNRVGPWTEGRMRRTGITTTDDLFGHQRYGEAAARIRALLDQRSLPELHALIRQHMHGAGHHLGVQLAGLVQQESLVMFDLETLGLQQAPVFLFGLAFVSGVTLEVHQFLARGGHEELAALTCALEMLGQAQGVVTFNGSTADIPWFKQRLAFYRAGRFPEILHLDLRYPAARRYQQRATSGTPLPDIRLQTLEKSVLGMKREMVDVPSAAVPDYYKHYERRHNIGPLVPIIDHNRADLVAVALLLERLKEIPEAW